MLYRQIRRSLRCCSATVWLILSSEFQKGVFLLGKSIFGHVFSKKKKKKAPKPFLIISAVQDRAAESLCNNGDYRI